MGGRFSEYTDGASTITSVARAEYTAATAPVTLVTGTEKLNMRILGAGAGYTYAN